MIYHCTRPNSRPRLIVPGPRALGRFLELVSNDLEGHLRIQIQRDGDYLCGPLSKLVRTDPIFDGNLVSVGPLNLYSSQDDINSVSTPQRQLEIAIPGFGHQCVEALPAPQMRKGVEGLR